MTTIDLTALLLARPTNLPSNFPVPSTHYHGWPGPLCACGAVRTSLISSTEEQR